MCLVTDDGIALRAAAHPIAPWYKRLWFRYQLMLCRVFGHDYSISVVDDADNRWQVIYTRCSRCSKHKPLSHITIKVRHG